MKKLFKVLFVLIVALVVIGGITFLIDASRVASGKTPICAIETAKMEDGGTTEYLGIGYKVIDFNMLNGYDEMKIGPWSMKQVDFKEEIEAFNQKLEEQSTPIQEEEPAEEENVEDEVSGEIAEPSGEEIIESGEITETEETNSGEEATEPQSGEETPTNEVLEEETASGEIPAEETKTEANQFKATITGIKQNTIIVMADEGEGVRNSSDLFSFVNPDDSVIYTQGQRVLVEFTGDINETYPASITVTKIEVIE